MTGADVSSELLKKDRNMSDAREPGDMDTENGTVDPYDINGPHFKPDVFLSKLLKERSLTELMDKETEMDRHIRSLDSNMQTLVYENYNKFISATDTIEKMKNDFRKMEDEMDELTANMAAITESSVKISHTLQERRQQITRLSAVHMRLQKLQFLFELPAQLQKCIEMQAYSQAVRYYTKTQKVLHQYQHMPSFQGIQHDCNVIVQQLSEKLREQFRNKESSARQLTECVDLLLQLNEPAEQLCEEFLSHARQKVDEDLAQLESQLKQLTAETPGGEQKNQDMGGKDDSSQNLSPVQPKIVMAPTDVLQFIDSGCNGFLSNICLVIASYNDMFLNRQTDDQELDVIALKKLVNFVNDVMEKYFSYVRQRVHLEKESGDNTILVRALDRFHRRLQAMNKLLPDTDFSRAGTEIVSEAASDRVSHYLDTLKQHFSDCLTDIRQNLAAPRFVGKHEGGGANLADMLHNLHTSVIDQIKSVLTNLQAFIASDITFAMKPYFRGPFCSKDVRQRLLVGFLQHILSVCDDFCEGIGDKGAVPPSLLLILARLCKDFEGSTISYLMTLAEEQFIIDDNVELTQPSELCTKAKDMAQKLLNYYVRVQGQTISQMLRKSVETRDWLKTIEPRNVRSVMKRVVEDMTAINTEVGQLYEEGVTKERSSDSTKRSFSHSTTKPTTRTNWSYTPSTVNNSILSNIQKLFSERIEIFSAVEFSKVSILTGIIKIILKTFLECVRLRTFGRYGLQQIQVDTHYLQLYLWRFVSDENLVHVLLDEIVASTVHRCLDPTTMEPSVSYNACNVSVLLQRTDTEFQVSSSLLDEPVRLFNNLDLFDPESSDPGLTGMKASLLLNWSPAELHFGFSPDQFSTQIADGSFDLDHPVLTPYTSQFGVQSIQTVSSTVSPDHFDFPYTSSSSSSSSTSLDAHPSDDLDQVVLKPLYDKPPGFWVRVVHTLGHSATTTSALDLIDNDCVLLSDSQSVSSDDSFERVSQMSFLPDDVLIMKDGTVMSADDNEVLILSPSVYFDASFCVIL